MRTPGSHFFYPAKSEPAFLPSQEIILGIYYLTALQTIYPRAIYTIYFTGLISEIESTTKRKKQIPLIFSKHDEVILRFRKGNLNISHYIWFDIRDPDIFDSDHDFVPYEICLSSKGIETKFSIWSCEVKGSSSKTFRTFVGRTIFSHLWSCL